LLRFKLALSSVALTHARASDTPPDIPRRNLYNPNNPLIDFRSVMAGHSFDRFFRDTGDLRHRRPSGRLWNPAADVYRTRDGWVVKIDLAGVRDEDIEITLDDDLLRVSGLRRDSFCGEGISHYQLEITYSRFEKVIQFPCQIEKATLERAYRDGLLLLHLRENEECREEIKRRAAAK